MVEYLLKIVQELGQLRRKFKLEKLKDIHLEMLEVEAVGTRLLKSNLLTWHMKGE
jgi:hypothetical protein